MKPDRFPALDADYRQQLAVIEQAVEEVFAVSSDPLVVWRAIQKAEICKRDAWKQYIRKQMDAVLKRQK